MKDYLIDIGPSFTTKEDLNEVLEHIVGVGGSDLYILGGAPMYGHINQAKHKICKRNLSVSEVRALVEEIAGEGSESKLGESDPLNPSYDYRIKKKNDEGMVSTIRRRFRVNIVPCLRNGERSITITIRPIPTKPPSVDEINVEKEIVDKVMEARQGMMLMVGATGTGKSTTLAACIRHRMENDPAGANLVSMEDPIEFVYDGVSPEKSFATQREVGAHTKTFESALQDAMRMHPDLILLGEIRSEETIRSALAAASSGHFLFSTMHTNSVAETLQRAVGFYEPSLQHQARLDILQAMTIICAQRLVPKIGGGVIALKEYLIFDQDIKNELHQSDSFVETANHLVKTRGISMRQAAQKAYDRGIIDAFQRDIIFGNYS